MSLDFSKVWTKERMKVLDHVGISVKVSDIPEYIILSFLRDTEWYKKQDTFYGKYIRPWLERKQTRIFDAMYKKAQCDVQLAVMNKVMEKAEEKIDGKTT